MGRATEFIHYINELYEPQPYDKIMEYHNVTFKANIRRARMVYRRNISKSKYRG